MSDPRITDEMVEAAARVDRASRVGYDDWETAPKRAQEHLLEHARDTLEAALSHLAPQPVDRDALSAELDAHIWKSWQRQGHLMAGCTCGWKDVDRGRLYSSAWRWHRLDAVLALVNGEAPS